MPTTNALLTTVIASMMLTVMPHAAVAQAHVESEASSKPHAWRGVEVKVSGSAYVDIAANFDAVPAFINQSGESHLVFTTYTFTSLADARRDMMGRNTTVQYGDTASLDTVRGIENFVAQIYGENVLLVSAIHNTFVLAKAGDVQSQQQDLASFGHPLGMSTIRRYRYIQDQFNDPFAELNNRERRGGTVFETVVIRPPLVSASGRETP